jgi:hypothetical protein
MRYNELSLLLFLLFGFNSLTYTQQLKITGFEYISPIPNSGYVSPYTNIIVRQGEFIDETTINNNLINITGLKSGAHSGKLFLADDGKTIIFNPENSFIEGETVAVKIEDGIKTSSGKDVSMLSFNFYISKSWAKNLEENSTTDFLCDVNILENRNQLITKKQKSHITSSITDTLPDDLPEYYISVFNNPSDGYIFMSPFPWPPFGPGYMIIMDNYGVPIFYRRCPIRCMDFKLNGNGLVTYFNRSTRKFYSLDSSYAMIDSFACGNGYSTDVHDLQVLASGHSLLMSYDFQTVRMDTIVPGGDTAASVIGLIIQELDENKNVIFQWRSWDHFKITDASDDIDLTAHTIDYVHGNSVESDIDGNLIISCRHMDEITKINRTTGKIIWRLGGKNNQFQFVNDPRGFSHQHDARRISNGNLMLFNNGNFLSPRYSSSLEYQLDESNKIANLVWYYSDISHYANIMGNSTRLSKGRTFIGWGSDFNPAVTEVKYDGTKTFELVFNSAQNYRAFRIPWRTKLLTADNYSVDFEYIPVNTIDTKEMVITNNSGEELVITSNFSRTSLFSITDSFPMTLQPYQNKTLQIQFSPDSIGVFSDDIHLRMQKENEMIAQVIKVFGYSNPSADVELENNNPNRFSLTQNYPNPFNPTTTIKYKIPEISFVTIKVYDVLGNEVATLVNEEKPAGSYEIEFEGISLTSGIYFYKIKAGDFIETKKMIMIK